MFAQTSIELGHQGRGHWNCQLWTLVRDRVPKLLHDLEALLYGQLPQLLHVDGTLRHACNVPIKPVSCESENAGLDQKRAGARNMLDGRRSVAMLVLQ